MRVMQQVINSVYRHMISIIVDLIWFWFPADSDTVWAVS